MSAIYTVQIEHHAIRGQYYRLNCEDNKERAQKLAEYVGARAEVIEIEA